MSRRVPLNVEMDDGRALKVIIDQRDFAAVEAQEFAPRTHAWIRYLAFSALRRTKQYGGTWDAFNTVDCVEATDVEESADAEDGLDPGRKAPGDGS